MYLGLKKGIQSAVASPFSNQYRYLNIYLVSSVALNLFFLGFKNHSADLGFWLSWIRQLQNNGYEGLHADYPPIYIHWLYLLGHFYQFFGLIVEKNILLRVLTQLPILISHLALVVIVFQQVKRLGWSSVWFHFPLAATVLNPAILLNGPLWGQVDLLPAVILVGAIVSGLSAKYYILMLPLYVLSLLTKFQMIAFAPVIGFLFFLRPLIHIAGAGVSLLLIAAAFLPWILIDDFMGAISRAYIDSVGSFPKSTVNAANLWMATANGNFDNTRQILNLSDTGVLKEIGQLKYVGMFTFSFISLLIFLKGAYVLFRSKGDVFELRSITWFLALLSAVSFFTILPAMHERYMFPAVVLSLMLAARDPKSIVVAGIVSILVTANMAITLKVQGPEFWSALSWMTVVFFAFWILCFLLGRRACGVVVDFVWRNILPLKSLSLFVASSLLALTVFMAASYYRVPPIELSSGEVFLTELEPISAKQDHGQYHLNRNYNGGFLSIRGKKYASGIGTHANSEIVFEVPHGAAEFRFLAGLDDVTQNADVKFVVTGDGQVLWESPIVYSRNRKLFEGVVELEGVSELSLIVEKVRSDRSDHANWVNPVISFGGAK